MPKYAEAQQISKTDDRIVASYITVPSPQGNGSIKGYFVRPVSADTRETAVAKLPVRGLRGGGVSYNLAVRMGADLAAAAPFYGGPPPVGEVPKIKAAVQVHHGALDTRTIFTPTTSPYQRLESLQMVLRISVGGIDLQRALELCPCLVETSHHGQRPSEQIVGVGVGRA